MMAYSERILKIMPIAGSYWGDVKEIVLVLQQIK